MKVTKDTIKISKLRLRTYPFSKGQTVQLKDTDPNELQRFIEKLPSSIKGETKSMNVISNTFFYFGFGTKRHMVEPLAVSHVVYKYRQIKLMARVQ